MAMADKHNPSQEGLAGTPSAELRLRYESPSISVLSMSSVIAGVAGSDLDVEGANQPEGAAAGRQGRRR